MFNKIDTYIETSYLYPVIGKIGIYLALITRLLKEKEFNRYMLLLKLLIQYFIIFKIFCAFFSTFLKMCIKNLIFNQQNIQKRSVYVNTNSKKTIIVLSIEFQSKCCINFRYLICQNEFPRAYTKDNRAEERGKFTSFFLGSIYYSCYD